MTRMDSGGRGVCYGGDPLSHDDDDASWGVEWKVGGEIKGQRRVDVEADGGRMWEKRTDNCLSDAGRRARRRP